ncbi:MAG: flagellar biosynthetic protein FliR [Proteobacteria bacterium]|nr:flagellar biosynthetic protein FliR [Pseudomonadota bacterium]MBS0574173.1 flagellar biosynthetic protein FliR [Pseudomonadota bacterium]
MSGQWQPLVDEAVAALRIYGLVFLRVGAAMALMPAFGDRVIPARIRLVLALSFSAVVAPAVGAGLPAVPATVAGFGGLLLGETLNGLALGFVLRLMLLAVEMAGSIAAQSGSLAQMFAAAGEPMPAIGHLLVMAATALALMSGLHVRAAGALILSYRAIPAGTLPGAALIESWSLAQVTAAFALAFSLAAPFVIAALLYNVALGFINRAMPGLMMAMVAAPALSAGVLVLLAVAAPAMLAVWRDGFAQLLADPFMVPR